MRFRSPTFETGKSSRTLSSVLKHYKVSGELLAVFQYLNGAYKKTREGLFTTACSDRTRVNGFKLKEGRFTLDIRKKFFTMRAVKHRNRLPTQLWVHPPWKCSRPGLSAT